MSSFYTVDRLRTLREGLVLEPTQPDVAGSPELQKHVTEMFPDGLTKHGTRYFLTLASGKNATSYSIEIVFEFVRRAYFPELPSRFHSVFAAASVEDATEFRRSFGTEKSSIWELVAAGSFRADMNLLTASGTNAEYSLSAHKYWRGEPSPRPFWEFLLIPPVRAVRKLQE
jgi:hypothetical protein